MQTVNRDLVIYGLDVDDSEAAIRTIGARLFEKGFVRDTYVDAVSEREKEYPTGLQLESMGVAMPHTTGAHVITPAVCVVKPAKPVMFKHMGTIEPEVQAEMIFMMAIKDPNAQLETLQKMMSVFTNAEAMTAFRAASSEEELWEAALKYIG